MLLLLLLRCLRGPVVLTFFPFFLFCHCAQSRRCEPGGAETAAAHQGRQHPYRRYRAVPGSGVAGAQTYRREGQRVSLFNTDIASCATSRVLTLPAVRFLPYVGYVTIAMVRLRAYMGLARL